jgi:hypothetical protein
MWMGHGSWGGPWGGFGWIFPLLGLVFMVLMLLFCLRRMGGTMCGCGMPHGQIPQSDLEALRREVRELREELHRVRGNATAPPPGT